MAEASAVVVQAAPGAAAGPEAEAEAEVADLPVLDAATFLETVRTLYSEVHHAMDELEQEGYAEYAGQITVWLKGLKQTYGEEFAGWSSALEKETRKPKAPPAICALRPQLHESAHKLKETLLVQWAMSAAEAKPAVQAARKRTAKALADAQAAKLKPVEKPPRKRSKSGSKALQGPAPAAALQITGPPSDAPQASTEAPPPVSAPVAGGDIPVALATVAAPLIDSTTGLITAMATVANGEAAAAAAYNHATAALARQHAATTAPSPGMQTEPAQPGAGAAFLPAVSDATVGFPAATGPLRATVSLSDGAVSLADVVDADASSAPIDAVSNAADGGGESADGSQVASWVVNSSAGWGGEAS